MRFSNLSVRFAFSAIHAAPKAGVKKLIASMSRMEIGGQIFILDFVQLMKSNKKGQ
jgi:hypothetical protein